MIVPSSNLTGCHWPICGSETRDAEEVTGRARGTAGNALRTSTAGNARRTSTAGGNVAGSIGGENITCLGSWLIASEITTIIEIPATAANHHLAVPRPGADLAAGVIDGGGTKAASGCGGGEARPTAVCQR